MADAIVPTKTCRKCGATFATKTCRPCVKAYMDAYRVKNADKIRAYMAANYAGKADQVNAKSKVWREANPEKMAEIYAARRAKYAADPTKQKSAIKAWADANRDKMKSIESAWRLANPNNGRIKSSNRRARKKENGGRLSKGIAERLFKLQQGKCACCGRPLGDNYHLDHIQPLSKGGENSDANVQLLTWLCNNQKFNKDPIDFMQSRGFLL